MESLRHLIGMFVKIAIALLLAVFVWGIVVLVKPPKVETTSTTATSTKSVAQTDWLPSPRKYSSLFGKTKEPVKANVYKPGPAFSYGGTQNGNDTSSSSPYTYIAYSGSGFTGSAAGGNQTTGTTIQPASNVTSTALPAERNLSVRNLSIYEGGHIYSGLTFVGEAKSELFKEGKFPIIVVDNLGRTVGVSAALAQDTWTVPGWVRFQTKIQYGLPVNVPCTMIFQEDLLQNEANRQPVRVTLPVICN